MTVLTTGWGAKIIRAGLIFPLGPCVARHRSPKLRAVRAVAWGFVPTTHVVAVRGGEEANTFALAHPLRAEVAPNDKS